MTNTEFHTPEHDSWANGTSVITVNALAWLALQQPRCAQRALDRDAVMIRGCGRALSCKHFGAGVSSAFGGAIGSQGSSDPSPRNTTVYEPHFG
jgi:hypothetical protein